jgi:hypothetical protein
MSDQRDFPVSRIFQVFGTLWAGLLVAYGIYGVWANDLWVTLDRRSQSHGLHLVGVPARLMLAAFVGIAASVFSMIACQHDAAKRELRYVYFSGIVGATSVALAVAASLLAGH